MYGKEGTLQICVTDILTEPGSLQLKAGGSICRHMIDRWLAWVNKFKVIVTQATIQ